MAKHSIGTLGLGTISEGGYGTDWSALGVHPMTYANWGHNPRYCWWLRGTTQDNCCCYCDGVIDILQNDETSQITFEGNFGISKSAGIPNVNDDERPVYWQMYLTTPRYI